MDKAIQNKKNKSLYFGLLVSMLGAAVFLILFEAWINDFIAMPLRVVSTSIAEFSVSLLGYDVIREGTSLVIGSFRFNVDTACSGSKTMQEMLAASILLAGIWRGFGTTQRMLAVLLAVPIAVVTNGLRVTGLMLASIRAGKGLPEETFEHQMIGILTFALALIIFWQMCRVLSRFVVSAWIDGVSRWVINILLYTVIFFPFIYESLVSWRGSDWNPYNRYAWTFALIAGVLLLREYRAAGRSSGAGVRRISTVAGTVLLSLGLVWAVVVTKLGFVSAQALGVLLVVSGYLVVRYGLKGFVVQLPLVVILSLSFPRIPLLINGVLPVSGGYDWLELFIGRVIVSGFLLGGYYLLKRFLAGGERAVDTADSKKSGTEYRIINLILLVCAGGGLLWQGYLDKAAVVTAAQNEKYVLFSELPGKVGYWTGESVELSESTKALLGGSEAELKVYSSDYALPVEFFYNYSDGNRHKLHPPEYCLTGAGWKIALKKSLILSGLNKGEFPITVMKLQNGREVRWFAFWFYNGVDIQADYVRMLADDLFLRLSGKSREWSIYRIIAYTEVDLLRFTQEIISAVESDNGSK